MSSRHALSGRHPQHAYIEEVVRKWFFAPMHPSGNTAEVRGWGTYWRHAQVHLSHLAVTGIDAFLADLQDYFQDAETPVRIYLNDRKLDTVLGPVLCAAGCRREGQEVFLVHVGAVPGGERVMGLHVQPVETQNLSQLVEAQLRAYANAEEPPDLARYEAELSRRYTELGAGGGLLATMDEEPAAMLWWQEAPRDIWINALGVRVPFRHRGVAQYLLRQSLAMAYGRGFRSVVLNAATDNADALRLCHRMGFGDEVYWQSCYLWKRTD
jgi:ribosomal protein S18 acetylase RimI-like enzyme